MADCEIKKTVKPPSAGRIPNPGGGQILIYRSDDGLVKLDVRLVNETLWLAQSDMAALFQCSVDNISLHLKNIYEEGERNEAATAEDFSVVRSEGGRSVRRTLKLYNLDAIISVGYRVKSTIATRFRIWATRRLREYIVKGFVIMVDYLCHLVLDRGGLKGRYNLAQGIALGCGTQ